MSPKDHRKSYIFSPTLVPRFYEQAVVIMLISNIRCRSHASFSPQLPDQPCPTIAFFSHVQVHRHVQLPSRSSLETLLLLIQNISLLARKDEDGKVAEPVNPSTTCPIAQESDQYSHVHGIDANDGPRQTNRGLVGVGRVHVQRTRGTRESSCHDPSKPHHEVDADVGTRVDSMLASADDEGDEFGDVPRECEAGLFKREI